jgi:nucleotide-binding universal stress UspA family protein
MHDVKHILVMSRSTADCKKAVHYGISLAKVLGARLSVLHVIHDPFSLKGLPFIISLREIEEEYRAMMVKAKKDLDKMIKAEKADGMVINEIVEEAEPVHEIERIVKNEKVDLLIVAAHDETRIEHVIYGRVNHEIARRLPCSLMLVKGK